MNPIIERQFTVVFWDISGFSELCEKLKFYPFTIAQILEKFFQNAVEIVQKYHGVLDKFIGDGILAYFGVDKISGRINSISRNANNGNPQNAVSAALEFKSKFSELKEDFERSV